MKQRIKSICLPFFSLILISLFLNINQTIGLAAASDYFTEVDTNGDILTGTVFYPDKPVIRPEYQGSWETLLNDIVDTSGKPYFTNFGEANKREYKKGTTIFYKNVGIHNKRSLSLKMTYVQGATGISTDWWYGTWLNEDGSLTQHTLGTSAAAEAMLAYQLVYTDTKEVVKDVYLEFPQVIFNHQGYNSNHKNYSYNSFDPKGLKKVYLTRSRDIQPTIVEMAKGPLTGKEILQAKLADTFKAEIPENFIILSDNNSEMILGVLCVFAYMPKFNIFSSSVEVPSVPTYMTPKIEGKKTVTDFQASYTIEQSVNATYDQYYPDNVTVLLEDKEEIFTSMEPAAIKITDRSGNNIKDKVMIKELAKDTLAIIIPNATLKELKSNSVKIDVDFAKLDLDKVLALYNTESASAKVPLSVSNTRKKAAEEIGSSKNESTAEILPLISATAIAKKVPINTTTADLAIEQLVTDLQSNIPGDIVKIIGITEEKVFDTVKKDSIKIKIQSQRLPELTRDISVSIDVTDDLITSSFFENQSWIIDQVNTQLAPKKINTNVYMSDLAKIMQINSQNKGSFKGQHIPKTIQYLRNLDYLALGETDLSGQLPEELGSLTKMTVLSIFGNSFTGGIPESLSNLKELRSLNLSRNNLIGRVSKSLMALPNLSYLKLDDNQLVGQVPESDTPFITIDISNNQFTYNSAEIPEFLANSVEKKYTGTFLQDLSLAGKPALSIKDKHLSTIKPFDESNQGYFNLHAMSENQTQLFSGHTYTILNDVTKKVLYEGSWDQEITIPYEKGMVYSVILDEAPLNPNNRYVIKTKIPELKLESLPSVMSFGLSLGGHLKKAVDLEGSLTIFDNRDTGNWKLSMTPSRLVSETKILKGEYSYIDSNGVETSIVNDQKASIETGISDTENELIEVSNNWNEKQGLQYTMNGSNYLGSYKGNVIWTLEDVPTSN
ncbi:hypothetical protein ACWOC1_13050 [Enterococcus quebecensis]|uniref:WxL domain-containing protein n=1 Tax=Enterococcus quebecensis TaxID=903983 RepID=A0A1E5GUD0_9ENTE|nr:hypothetical protein [Enterococcus quebecensis]OEG15920.1 hypothetical protein BCR23_07165 [Enterococcus quebecensis]OJG74891.1 hypothetical protein RV12_GL001936 [Enterococcus quebecensis]